MISVPNHPRLLNGSKRVLYLALSFFLLVGCDAFKKAQTDPEFQPNDDGTLDEIQGTRVYDPEQGRWVIIEEAPSEKMDTIRWTNIPETRMPPITSEGMNVPLPRDLGVRVPGSDRSTFQVAVMLPFLANRVDATAGEIKNNVSNWSINFYGGMQLALDRLEAEGLSMNVSVIDTEANPERMQRLLENRADVRNAELIVGPYRRENIRLAAAFSKRENVVLVSPYSASANLTSENPNFIQVSPTLETHCQSLAHHALEDFAPENVIFVSRDVGIERQCLDIMMKEHYTMQGTSNPEVVPEKYVVPHAEAPYEDIDLLPLVEGRDDLAFVIPSWADETFVYSFLRELDVVCEPEQRVVVYGMPQWVNYQHIDYDYYERFHVRVSSNIFIDDRDPDVIDFKRNYFERFGAIPNDPAFLGYDVTMYFGELLAQYGMNFQTVLDANASNVLHTRFDFQKVVEPTTTGAENLPVERYENDFVNILEFRDYRFERLNR